METSPASSQPQKGYAAIVRTLLAMLVLCGAAPMFADSVYRSVFVDGSGQLHFVLESGKEVLPQKTHGQTSFGDPEIAADGRAVGWLAMYPDPSITYYKGAEIAGGLVIYRDGHVLHTFSTDQIFWDWQFQDDGKRVAYSTGPTHGGAAECVLRDVKSGRILARWRVQSSGEPPAWAQTLRR